MSRVTAQTLNFCQPEKERSARREALGQTKMTRAKYIRDPWVDRPTYPSNKRRGGRLPRKIMMACDPTILWEEADQAWAISEGFFIARSPQTERVIIVTISNKNNLYDIADPIKQQLAAIAHIQRRVLACDPMYDKLLWFIEQQDREGYKDAWIKTVEFRDPEYTWYKLWVARKKMARGMSVGYYGERVVIERERRIKISEAAKRRRHEQVVLQPKEPLATATIALLSRLSGLSREDTLKRREERSKREAADREAHQRSQAMARKSANARYYQKRKLALKLARERAKALGENHENQETRELYPHLSP